MVDKLDSESNARKSVRVRISPVAPMSKSNQKYSKELLEEIVKDCNSFAAVIRKLGLKQAGGNQSYLTRRIREFGIDTSHFRGQANNYGDNHKGGNEKLIAAQVLVYNRNDGRREHAINLRRAMIESGVPEECAHCCLGPKWNGEKLVLQIDHKDGDFLNNRLENLRFLCPNCHSQTETFGAKNLS